MPYGADELYRVASDVGAYRDFLPLVKRSTVRSRQESHDGRDVFDAELVLVYPVLKLSETFVSRVVADPATRSVTARSQDGPLQTLYALWRIVPLADGGSEVEFSVDYSLRSRTLQAVLSGMFDYAVRKVMTAFEDRARTLYGAPAA